MIGRLLSFWGGPFSGAMLVLGRVIHDGGYFLRFSPKSSNQQIHNKENARFDTIDIKNVFGSGK